MTWCVPAAPSAISQNSLKASWSAFALENPRAEAAACRLPNWRARAETLWPGQFPCPGVPAFGMVSPVKENVALNVRTGLSAMMSVPMRSQSGVKSVLRIQDCKSPANGVPGATIGFGADRNRKSPPAT